MTTRTIKSLTSRCEARIYHFNTMVLGDGSSISDSEITAATITDIKSDDNVIMSFSFEKSIEACAGSFSLVLAPSVNWMTKIRPGDWIAISLGQKGALGQEARCLGNVDRISQIESVQQDGKRVINYQVTGRDFGKVLEKYSVWFNNYSPEVTTQLTLLESTFETVGTSKDIISKILDVFLGGQLEAGSSSSSTLDAWRIPGQLGADFSGPQSFDSLNGSLNITANLGPGTSSVMFNDILFRAFDDVPGYKPTSAANLMVGSLWEMIRIYANPVVNEVFTELRRVDGVMRPSLFLRVYPFTKRSFSPPSGFGSVPKFEELEHVDITGADIIGSNIGVADHDRINLFFLYGDVPALKNTTETALFSKPVVNKASVRRYGLNAYIVPTSFIASAGTEQVPTLVAGWNTLLQHWFTENANLESGTFTIIGNNEVKVGKRLLVSDSKSHDGKEFYIEGYSDSWTYPGIWTQTVQVTRGQILKNMTESSLTIENMSERTDLTGQTNAGSRRL